MKQTLFVVARMPYIGAGKTRLARALGSVPAAQTARALLVHTLREAKSTHWETRIALTPDSACAARAGFMRGLPCIPQGGGDLGARLRRLLCWGGPVVVIGSDCPGLRRAHLHAAFRALLAHDVVIGPAEDGGFWLLGVRRRPGPHALRAVRWSTDHACADTLKTLAPARIKRLATLYDVDEIPTYTRWRRAAKERSMSHA